MNEYQFEDRGAERTQCRGQPACRTRCGLACFGFSRASSGTGGLGGDGRRTDVGTVADRRRRSGSAVAGLSLPDLLSAPHAAPGFWFRPGIAGSGGRAGGFVRRVLCPCDRRGRAVQRGPGDFQRPRIAAAFPLPFPGPRQPWFGLGPGNAPRHRGLPNPPDRSVRRVLPPGLRAGVATAAAGAGR